MSQIHSASAVNEIDVRDLVPAPRHQKVFELIDQPAPGGSFVLANDHDPRPPYYQFEAEHRGQGRSLARRAKHIG